MSAQVPPRRLRRSATGAVLGGVCAGVARSAGLDPLLLRIALVAATVLTGGAGVPAYLVAWVLIPREPAAPDGPAGTDADTSPVGPGVIPPPRSPPAATDDAATPGDRLRTPEVQAGARKAAASVTEIARRVRGERG